MKENKELIGLAIMSWIFYLIGYYITNSILFAVIPTIPTLLLVFYIWYKVKKIKILIKQLEILDELEDLLLHNPNMIWLCIKLQNNKNLLKEFRKLRTTPPVYRIWFKDNNERLEALIKVRSKFLKELIYLQNNK